MNRIFTKLAGLLAILSVALLLAVPALAVEPTVVVNEVESNGGVPGDWIELYNVTAAPISLEGYFVKDNDDSRTFTLPAGTTIAAGGYYVVEESAFGFGLGGGDSARLFAPDNMTLVDSYTWTAHAATTYGRCPNATGEFKTNTTSTKGAANDCSVAIRINEIESNGGTPGDWVELFNPGPAPADLTGFVFKDNDDTHSYPIVAAPIPVGGYLVLDQAQFGFGLGQPDSARLFRPDGTLADSYAWPSHAAVTYGRCPNNTGDFADTFASTKGAANSCSAPVTTVHINEIESNGGTPGDWVELINTGAGPIDISGWSIKDADDTHNFSILPSGSIIPAGGYLIVEETALGFGLGTPDSVRLFDPAGTLYEMYSWTPHAATTYGRCPDGTGAFSTTTSSTKGAANDCGSAVRINEVESDGGTPGDWIELVNPSGSPVDISGFIVRDSDDANTYTIPSGTTIAAGGYYVLEGATLGFGLSGADGARLFNVTGLLVDSYTWTAHATTTYGRCPNGTGAFTTTTSSTKGLANVCPGELNFLPWPGGAEVATADGTSVFGGNLSGLDYEGSGSSAPGVLWAVRNGPESLFRLIFDGTIWTPDPANDWGAGKLLHYADGTGKPDSEGVTYAGTGSTGGLYVSTERNNEANTVSKNVILRFDPAASGTSLTATHEWNLTADLPVVGPNLGVEAITWIPDSFLVAGGFLDENKGHTYSPAEYPNHGSGLFFVGVEANGQIYAYALDQGGTAFTRVATIASGFTGVMDLQFDAGEERFWAICDDTCNGRSSNLAISPTTGKFVVSEAYERPGTMPNINNEGFAIASKHECVSGLKPAFWADDSQTDGHSIRKGTVPCTAPATTPVEVVAPSPSKAYGADLPSLLPTYVGLTGGELETATPATCFTTATASSPPDTYPVTCSGAADPKYDISYTTGTLTVTKASLTVDADDKSREFGQNNPALTVSYSGFVLGQTLANSGVSGSPSCSTTAAPASPPADYPITCSTGTLSAANYSFDLQPGTLTLSKAGTKLTPNLGFLGLSRSGPTLTLRATLTSTATGSPIAGQTVRFDSSGPDCAGITNARGIASCSVPLFRSLGRPFTISYAGNDNYRPTST